jgi:glutathione S-transferase
MNKPVLVIGNKNYSSWSLRPYMALAMAGIAFDEKMIRFGEPRFSREIRKLSKAGHVPVLLHKGLTIWDMACKKHLAQGCCGPRHGALGFS